MTLSQNHIMDHSNSFDLLPLESQLLGQPIYFMDIYDLGRFHDSIKTPIGTLGYRYDPFFAAFAGIKFIPDKKSYSFIKNKILQIETTAVIDPAYSRFLDKYPAIAASIKLCFFQKKKMVREILLPFGLKDLEDGKRLVNIDPELPAGNYHFEYSIETPGYNPTHNSDKIKLRIKEGVVQ